MASNKCTRCGKASGKHQLCSTHRADHVARNIRLQKRKKKNGTCWKCDRRTAPGKILCAHHLKLDRERKTPKKKTARARKVLRSRGSKV